MDSASAIILENDRGEVLLLRRGPTAPWMPGKWNLPGGTVDSGESIEQTAIRETLEETALSVSSSDIRIVSDRILEYGRIVIFHSRRFSGNLNLSWENTESVWVRKADALHYDLVPGIDRALAVVASE